MICHAWPVCLYVLLFCKRRRSSAHLFRKYPWVVLTPSPPRYRVNCRCLIRSAVGCASNFWISQRMSSGSLPFSAWTRSIYVTGFLPYICRVEWNISGVKLTPQLFHSCLPLLLIIALPAAESNGRFQRPNLAPQFFHSYPFL